jgi:hypothetical protein
MPLSEEDFHGDENDQNTDNDDSGDRGPGFDPGFPTKKKSVSLFAVPFSQKEGGENHRAITDIFPDFRHGPLQMSIP